VSEGPRINSLALRARVTSTSTAIGSSVSTTIGLIGLPAVRTG